MPEKQISVYSFIYFDEKALPSLQWLGNTIYKEK